MVVHGALSSSSAAQCCWRVGTRIAEVEPNSAAQNPKAAKRLGAAVEFFGRSDTFTRV